MKHILFIILVLVLCAAESHAHTLYGNICVTEKCTCRSNGICRQEFPDGTQLTLVARPDDGKYFVGWRGDTDCIRPLACTIVMDRDRHITAAFDDLRWLRVEVRGSGTVTSNPSGISANHPSWRFENDSIVTLTAIPNSGYVFKGWKLNVGSCQISKTCKVSMTTNKIVVAIFEKAP